MVENFWEAKKKQCSISKLLNQVYAPASLKKNKKIPLLDFRTMSFVVRPVFPQMTRLYSNCNLSLVYCISLFSPNNVAEFVKTNPSEPHNWISRAVRMPSKLHIWMTTNIYAADTNKSAELQACVAFLCLRARSHRARLLIPSCSFCGQLGVLFTALCLWWLPCVKKCRSIPTHTHTHTQTLFLLLHNVTMSDHTVWVSLERHYSQSHAAEMSVCVCVCICMGYWIHV